MKLTKICDGQADREKTFELINRGYGPDQFFAGQWFETNEECYWYFLECLPPMDFSGSGFSMCEFSTGYLTNAFFERGGKFYCMTIERQNAGDFYKWMKALFDEIKAEEYA